MKFLLLISLLFLSACSMSSRVDNTYSDSTDAEFVVHQIQAEPFLLTSYERISSRNGVANVYIEGDGNAWLSKKKPSLDPTPKNPMALKLAELDPAKNVTYLARPCQYTRMSNGSVCGKKYWTSHRFAPEVIEAMDHALDDVKQRHQITGFNLIGFSGGGNIAALLVAKRGDVLSLRTVAGNLDHQLQSQIHNVSSMPYSLNAKDVAHQISDVPQIHLIGGDDTIITEDIYESYRRAALKPECMKSYIVGGVTHINGWEALWTSLLAKIPNCDVAL